MTVTTTVSNISYPNAVGLGPYAFPMRVMLASQLVVTSATTANPPVVTTLVNGTDYTVTGLTNRNGGSITLINAPVGGPTITIARIVPLVQLTDLRNQGSFFPENYEDALDYVTWCLQEIASSGGTLVINTGTSSTGGVQVSVKDHGAIGNGVADDTAAFAATIAALGANGGTVFVPPGVYLINPNVNGGFGINMVSNMTLWIAAGATLKAKASNVGGEVVVRAQNVSNVAIVGQGVIDANRAQVAHDSNSGLAVQFNKVINGRIEGITVQNSNCDAIALTPWPTSASGSECVNISVTDVFVTNAGRNGLAVTGAIRVRVTHCDFANTNGNNPQAGIDLEVSAGTAVVEDVVVAGCTFTSNTNYGIQFGACQDCTVVGSVFRGHGIAGVFLAQAPIRTQVVACHVTQASATSTGILLDFSQGALVSSCVVDGTFLQGIWSRGGASPATNGKNDLVGNTVVGDGVTANQIGIAGSNGADRTNVVGGSVTSCVFGVQLANCDWSTVSGVIARLNTNYGIEISTCQYASVTGCTAEGNTLVGIIFDDNSVFCKAVGNTAQGNGTIGIETAVGSDDCMIEGNTCLENSQTTTATSDNILLAGNRGLCVGNQVRIGNKTNQPRYGIQVAAGTGNNVRNNDVVTGGITGLIHDAATSTQIRDNPGYNPQGWTFPGVGASPATVTNSTASPVLAYVVKGTCSDVTHSVGGTIAGATNVQSVLQPGESLVITYSSAPTVSFQGL